MNFRELNHKKNFYMRHLKLKVGKFLFDAKNKNHFMVSQVTNFKKILFLRNDNKIGDMIVSTFAFRELKKQLPSVEISVLAGPNAAQILQGNPYVDHVFIYKKGFQHLFWLGRMLKQEHFDLYIDLDKQPTAQTLYLLSRVRPRFAFGFNRQEYRLYNITAPFAFDAHITQWYAKVFEILGLQNPSGGYDLFLPENSIRRAEEFLRCLPPRPNIIVNMFGASRYRCLCAEQIKTLVKLMPNYNVVVVGEARRVENFKNSFHNQDMPNLFWQPKHSTLYDVFGFIGAGDLFLSPDTGLVHAASALGKKQVCIYKSSDLINQKTWAPLGPAVIIQAPDSFSNLDMKLVANEIEKYI